MKRILAILGLCTLNTVSAIDYRPTDAECKTVEVEIGKEWISASFKKAVTFPTPPEQVYLVTGDTLTCPSVYVSRKGEYMTLRTVKEEDLANIVNRNLPIVVHSVFSMTPTLKMTNYTSIRLNYEGGMNGLYQTDGGTTVTPTLKSSPVDKNTILHYPLNSLIAGYRINGGPLKPLFYDAKVTPVEKLKKGDRLEIYMKPHQNVVWQKIVIDRKTNTVELYREAPFPQ